MNPNTPYYIAITIIFLLLKLAYTQATNDHMVFLLEPTNQLVELLTSSESIYITTSGYFYSKINIVIDKSCSGFNFWILSFIMVSFLAVKHLKIHVQKIILIPLALTITFILTVLVNSSRIFVAVIVQNQANIFLPVRPHYLLHEIVGITTNLVFLIIIYVVIERFFTKGIHNAKSA